MSEGERSRTRVEWLALVDLVPTPSRCQATLRKECLGWSKYTERDLPELEKELTDYLVYYHPRRAHLGLGCYFSTDF